MRIVYFLWIFIILFIFYTYMYALKPSTDQAKKCFTDSKTKSEEILTLATREKWGQEEICTRNKEIMLYLNSCMENVNYKNKFFPYIFRLHEIKDKYSGIINNHNVICPMNSINRLEY